MKRKLLAWALLLCLLVSLFPNAAFADGEIAEEPTEPVILSDSEGSQADVPETAPVGADAPGGPQTAAVILRSDSDGESQTLAEPEDEILLAAQTDTQDASIVASGECGANGDNLSWTLDDAGTLTISGEGAMADYSNDIPWYDHMSEIKNLVLMDGVTSIGDNAFSGCGGLMSVTLPESITSIGDKAFSGCRSLASITISNNVTSIGYCAFEGCSSLMSILIPESVTSIGYAAFYGCRNLTSIQVADGNPSYSSKDGVLFDIDKTQLICCPCNKSGVYSVPDSVTNIVGHAFYCSNLTSIAIPQGVTSIGGYAFFGCHGLTSITLPASVTSIDNSAFSACTNLTSITLPAGLTSVGREAFADCSRLTSITLPEGMTSIGTYAFHYCSGLTNVTIPSSVTSIGEGAFIGCSGLTDVYYAGTEAQKNALLGNGWSTELNDPFFNATWHYETAQNGRVAIGSATGIPGGTVTLPVELKGNPGISYLELTLDYDTSKLELTEISTEGSCLGGNWTLNTAKGVGIWVSPNDSSATGTLLTLRFLVKEDAAEGPVTVSASGVKAFNVDDELFSFDCEPGTVTVKQRVPGDLTGDGEVDGRDLTRLARYLAAYEVTLIEQNADVTGDGVVNGKDLTRLARYLAKFDVVLE